ncbi:DMT family transporter [Mammaliicoccus vitulinus]|uniref:DMT family transporter n=1 Tax=Mammaliicoccus vitulinus TaxID=71237 RepID=A0ABX7HCR1_9STAP|nr:DMT family transporter [Mammaliicoccus vitulinus]MBM6628496.1 DMT family transporter [Mammaliicoccus vitulinus]MBO3078106.1 DMT family transporter [Mammaliicoccus vitulinus]MEB7658006.1 DMT family transporter [Mammaliicoccus vitulinus]PNZ37223.1 EamA-like transporter family protein [Mammaliicoccus vitulinus]QJF25524.1 DMT family transporter [Mammaliicoccus vitulinus]
MKVFIYIIAILAGSVLSFESAIYGKLGENIGQLETSFYNFLMGTLILGILVLFFGKGEMSFVPKAPKWSLLGGILGVIYLTVIVVSVPFVGVGITMTAVIIGQLIMSMVVEHFGWLGIERTRVNKEKIFAVIAMVIALILIY